MPRRKRLEKTQRKFVRMYDMTSTPAFETNLKFIIALRSRGNKSENVEGSVWFIWFNQIDATDQINQIDYT